MRLGAIGRGNVRWLGPLAVAAGLLALAACAAREEAKPPAAPAPAAGPSWEEEWERLAAAAKREGRVVVTGPTGADERRAVTEPFQRKYGITVEYTGIRGAEFPPRIKAERAASQYLWDVFLGGTTTIILDLKPEGILDPIEPALILPEVKDPKSWREGRIYWVEKNRLGIAMTPRTRETIFINKSLARVDDFKTYRDLLDPKWKGKIVVGRDPRQAGPGQATFTLFYRHPELGPDFIRALAKQDLQVLRDDRQALEWLAQGRYAIAIGVSPRESRNMMDAGLPIDMVDPRRIKEGGDLSSGSGNVALFNRAPHPNAARVYINWLLSQEGQASVTRAWGYPSWRVDAPTDHLEPWAAPLPGSVDTFSEEAMQVKGPLVRLLQELWGR